MTHPGDGQAGGTGPGRPPKPIPKGSADLAHLLTAHITRIQAINASANHRNRRSTDYARAMLLRVI